MSRDEERTGDVEPEWEAYDADDEDVCRGLLAVPFLRRPVLCLLRADVLRVFRDGRWRL